MKTLIRIVLMAAATIAVAPSTSAGEYPIIAGRAGITDGDTIRMPSATWTDGNGGRKLKNIRVRLFGIDAPEDGQPCFEKDGRPWDCSGAATKAVAELIGSSEVICEVRDIDRFDRPIGICSVPGVPDINAEIVKRGLAVAYRKYAMDYVEEEETARKGGVGMWRGEFMMPWDWRKLH